MKEHIPALAFVSWLGKKKKTNKKDIWRELAFLFLMTTKPNLNNNHEETLCRHFKMVLNRFVITVSLKKKGSLRARHEAWRTVHVLTSWWNRKQSWMSRQADIVAGKARSRGARLGRKKKENKNTAACCFSVVTFLHLTNLFIRYTIHYLFLLSKNGIVVRATAVPEPIPDTL